MFESTTARSELFVKMQRYLADKSGPIRPDNLLLALLTETDRRVLRGTLARCGFEHKPEAGPCWFRAGSERRAAA
jgi:hypothetical protein